MEEGVPAEAARGKALAYLARKEHSAREVHAYLRRKGCSEDTACEVTQSLLNSGIVDDVRLAEMILRSAPGRGWGPSRARQELLRRGIDRETAEESVRRLYPEEDFSVALSLGMKKWPLLKGEGRLRESKLAAYLGRRGFSASTVIEVLNTIRSEGP